MFVWTACVLCEYLLYTAMLRAQNCCCVVTTSITSIMTAKMLHTICVLIIWTMCLHCLQKTELLPLFWRVWIAWFAFCRWLFLSVVTIASCTVTVIVTGQKWNARPLVLLIVQLCSWIVEVMLWVLMSESRSKRESNASSLGTVGGWRKDEVKWMFSALVGNMQQEWHPATKLHQNCIELHIFPARYFRFSLLVSEKDIVGWCSSRYKMFWSAQWRCTDLEHVEMESEGEMAESGQR